MLLMLLIRAALYHHYKHHFKPELVKQYGLYLTLGSGLTGLIWGVGAAIMLPIGNFEYQIFIVFVISAMGIGATSSLSVYLPAFFAFFPVLMLPTIFRFMTFEGSIEFTLSAMGIIYVLATSLFNINLNRNLKETIRLRFENSDLVAQLREQKIQADNANKAKSKFLAAASHDLRQPLYALSLFSSTLDGFIQYPEVRKIARQIKTSVTSMKGLFNSLLDISQLDAGVIKPDKTNFLLQPLFKILANDFDPQAVEKGLFIAWPSEAFAIHSDRDIIEQILRNLISNAIRYSNEGRITISCKRGNNELLISIEDTGIGIAEEDQHSIFEEYNQLDNLERDRQKGLGLGLALVKRSAKLLEHHIALESQLGKGSKFSLSVEICEIDSCNIDPDPSLITEVAITNESLLIIIDDDSVVLEGTQTLFVSWGCDVITASSINEAMSKLKRLKQRPDGIITDYRLRDGETGIHAIQTIHKHYDDNIPALIVSGDIAVERLQEVANSGFQMLHKPVEALKLRTFLRKLQHPKK